MRKGNTESYLYQTGSRFGSAKVHQHECYIPLVNSKKATRKAQAALTEILEMSRWAFQKPQRGPQRSGPPWMTSLRPCSTTASGGRRCGRPIVLATLWLALRSVDFKLEWLTVGGEGDKEDSLSQVLAKHRASKQDSELPNTYDIAAAWVRDSAVSRTVVVCFNADVCRDNLYSLPESVIYNFLVKART
jgi:hypothetical protein